MQAVDYDPFAVAELESVLPSTPAQKEIWLATRMASDASLAFNESVSLHLRGALNQSRLRTALGRLVAHHQSLRGSFSPDDGRFCIAIEASVPLRLDDFSALPLSD